MKVGDSVRHALEDWGRKEFEAAMLHACNAVDGTSGKVYPKLKRQNQKRFTRFLRENYSILGPMGIPGINIVETRFPINVENPTASGGQPDLADVIYCIHRCTHGHGDELPDGFDLIAVARDSPGYTRMEIQRGKVRLSDRIIFGLLAVAVLSPANRGQTAPKDYWLSYGQRVMPINEWWGRADDFPAILAAEPSPPTVTMDFSRWIPRPQT